MIVIVFKSCNILAYPSKASSMCSEIRSRNFLQELGPFSATLEDQSHHHILPTALLKQRAMEQDVLLRTALHITAQRRLGARESSES